MYLENNDPQVNYDIISDNDSLFHFTKFDATVNYIFENKSLLFNPFIKTSDPREYKKRFIGYDCSIGITDDQRHVIESGKKIIENTLLYNSYFLSTCMNKNNKIFDINKIGCFRSRMWSQYGENHKGVCLVLSKSAIVNEISKKYIRAKYLLFFQKVKYNYDFDNTYFNAMLHADKVLSNTPEDFAIKYMRKEKNNLFFMKHKDYKDENEYRFVIIKKFESADALSISLSNVLKCVIIGERQNRIYIPSYRLLEKRLNVPFYLMNWQSGKYVISGC